MVLPEPTSPNMYIPFGRLGSIGGSAFVAGAAENMEKNDFLGGWSDSMVGCCTVGCVHDASIWWRSSRFLMMSVQHEYFPQLRASYAILLWCSSSLNRPLSTRASYSAIGPCVLSGLSVETAPLAHAVSFCAYPTYTPLRPAHTLSYQPELIAQQWQEAGLSRSSHASVHHQRSHSSFSCNPNIFPSSTLQSTLPSARVFVSG